MVFSITCSHDRRPAPAFWKSTEELFKNQKIPLEIPGALFPYLCVCGATFRFQMDSEQHAKKHLEGARHIEIFHSDHTNIFPGPCVGTKIHPKDFNADCILRQLICAEPYCHYLASTKDEITFHQLLTHNVLDGVLGRGFPLGGREVLGIKHCFEYYRNHEPEFQRRLRRLRSLRSSLQPIGGPIFNSLGHNVASTVVTPEIYWLELDREKTEQRRAGIHPIRMHYIQY